MRAHRLAAIVALIPLLTSHRAHALDRFEIQVYEDDVDDPGHAGLELHANYTIAGRTTPDYPGQIPPDRAARLTLEPSFGVTDFLELGGYLQGFVAPGEGAKYGGVKLRTKFVVPKRAGLPLMLGLNIEIGRVPHTVEEEGWANEFRPIIGYSGHQILAVVNPIFGYALSGPDRFQPDFEPAAKLAYDTRIGFSVGAEYYAGLGQFKDGLSPVHEQEHLLFGVFDLVPSENDSDPLELNLGVGKSLTDATGAHWIVKLITGKQF
jgi:hypothetical protein